MRYVTTAALKFSQGLQVRDITEAFYRTAENLAGSYPQASASIIRWWCRDCRCNVLVYNYQIDEHITVTLRSTKALLCNHIRPNEHPKTLFVLGRTTAEDQDGPDEAPMLKAAVTDFAQALTSTLPAMSR